MPNSRTTLLVGVAGGSGSGKTTLAHALQSLLKSPILAQDHYYLDQSARFNGDGEAVNFDHPSAIDFTLLASHLAQLKSGLSIQVPQYCFVTHTRKPEVQLLKTHPIIIIDGTLILAMPEVRELLDFSVFVGAPESIRYERRLYRDTHERGRTPEGVRKQFERQVKPMHDAFVEPSKTHAHLQVSGEAVIDQITQVVLDKITKLRPL